MANFLNTSALNFLLEELMRTAKKELILVSPYLKLNERVRELLYDRSQQVDIQIIYGKKDLQQQERQWIAEQKRIKIGFCKNLHAKCYLNENYCIVTSMNLYDFSQVNNNEMGISLHKAQDRQLYTDIYKEVQRLIRISDATDNVQQEKGNTQRKQEYAKLTTARLAGYYGKRTTEMFEILLQKGHLTKVNNNYELTEKGRRELGGEKRTGYDGGTYFLWNKPNVTQEEKEYRKLTTARLAIHFKKTSKEMFKILVQKGCLTKANDEYELTEKGRQKLGGEKRTGKDGSHYFLWKKPDGKK
ncbi:MAG: DNA repair protein [Candidatus Electrothrix sp. LOE1_4_5]|nr:DNA repair protein [Candidatus Electrothrix gigas]